MKLKKKEMLRLTLFIVGISSSEFQSFLEAYITQEFIQKVILITWQLVRSFYNGV